MVAFKQCSVSFGAVQTRCSTSCLRLSSATHDDLRRWGSSVAYVTMVLKQCSVSFGAVQTRCSTSCLRLSSATHDDLRRWGSSVAYVTMVLKQCSPSHCRARHGRTGLSRLLHHKYTAPIIANLKGAGPGCLQGAATQEDPHSDLIHFAGSALASHTPLHASFLRDDTALAQYSAHRLAWNPFGFESCKLT
eukprot:1158396-Pelagomonas_calceolata.AAC.19